MIWLSIDRRGGRNEDLLRDLAYVVFLYKSLSCRCVARFPSNRQRKSALSQNSGELHGLAPDIKRSEAVFQVDPLVVVELHILRHHLFDFGTARKSSPIQALCFQRPEKIFHRRIVIGTSRTGYRRLNVVLSSGHDCTSCCSSYSTTGGAFFHCPF